MAYIVADIPTPLVAEQSSKEHRDLIPESSGNLFLTKYFIQVFQDHAAAAMPLHRWSTEKAKEPS
jgi:hypothetical protein